MKTVQESLRHADSKVSLDVFTQGTDASEKGSTTQGDRDEWTHLDPRIFNSRCRCLIVKVGRVAQLAEQCPFKAWVDGSSPSALTTQPSRIHFPNTYQSSV